MKAEEEEKLRTCFLTIFKIRSSKIWSSQNEIVQMYIKLDAEVMITWERRVSGNLRLK